MEIALFQVDAFSSRVFSGNPAAVCPLSEWLTDDVMQAIAAENNLAETAFLVSSHDRFQLRWFTPACEVDLCGHATLASAYVLFNYLGAGGEKLFFDTKSGELTVRRDSNLLVLNFPSRPALPVEASPGLLSALGGPPPLEVLAARDYLVRYRSEDEIRQLKPNLAALMNIDRFAVIVTAPGDQVDFVSRFFAPAKGVPEDPVTGSAHTSLIPYWAERLGKTKLEALQVSARGGHLYCELLGDRVEISGEACLYLRGQISI
jgi:predicted PhzF superfamily epimerase YddE/YHI9